MFFFEHIERDGQTISKKTIVLSLHAFSKGVFCEKTNKKQVRKTHLNDIGILLQKGVQLPFCENQAFQTPLELEDLCSWRRGTFLG